MPPEEAAAILLDPAKDQEDSQYFGLYHPALTLEELALGRAIRNCLSPQNLREAGQRNISIALQDRLISLERYQHRDVGCDGLCPGYSDW